MKTKYEIVTDELEVCSFIENLPIGCKIIGITQDCGDFTIFYQEPERNRNL